MAAPVGVAAYNDPASASAAVPGAGQSGTARYVVVVLDDGSAYQFVHGQWVALDPVPLPALTAPVGVAAYRDPGQAGAASYVVVVVDDGSAFQLVNGSWVAVAPVPNTPAAA